MRILRIFGGVTLLVGSVALVIVGHQSIGPVGLGVMFAGLAGLLLLLYLYNRRYR